MVINGNLYCCYLLYQIYVRSLSGEFQFFVKQCLTLFRRLLTFLLLYRYFCNHFFQGWLQNVHLLRGAFASIEQTLSMQLLRNFLWAVYEISFFTKKNLVFAFRKSISTDLGPEFNCPRYQTLNCKNLYEIKCPAYCIFHPWKLVFFRYPFSKSNTKSLLDMFGVCTLSLRRETVKARLVREFCRGAELRALCKTLRLWYGSQPEKRPE